MTVRERLLIPACIAAITLLAWIYLFHLDRQMSASMDYDRQMAAMGMAASGQWTAADGFLNLAMWVVMMVGMMAGSVTPMLQLFAGTQAAPGQPRTSQEVLAFGLGYLLIWSAFSAVATLAQWALHSAALLTPAMKTSNPWLGGGILVAAGIYQLTPWKGKCLQHCRSPLGFLMTNWRSGKSGAIRMGAGHGLYCLGCCWALMAVLFVVGVMNLFWVAVLTIIVLLEKMGPAAAVVAKIVGVAMIVRGVFVIATIG